MDMDGKIYKTFHLLRYEDNVVSMVSQDFVREEPLMIRVEDKPYSVVMRTPGDEIAHAAGFCFSEGLIESPDDIASIGFCSDLDENSIMVSLNDGRKRSISKQLESRGFFSQTSCGVCGRKMIEDLTDNLKAIDNESKISYKEVLECVKKFFEHQEHYARTRGTHAVMLFDSKFDIIAKAEDVGRHNAMDKSIGTLFLKNKISDVYLAVLSSRISFEMIQKAARAQIPIIVSLSHPTSMAVELGLKFDITLVCLDKKSGFIVPCGERRIGMRGNEH